MTPNLTLKIANGFLRPLVRADLHPGYVEGLNNPTVNLHLEVRREEQTDDSVASFIVNNSQSTDSVLWGIWLRNQPRHIGTIRLHDINSNRSHCYIGICIFDSSAWGRGIGTDAIKAVTSWAHMELSIQRIEAHAYLENTASIRTFEKAGYRRLKNRNKSIAAEVHPILHAVLVADSVMYQ
jgi:RimJ/RimL family protein N-acetyltransferase